MISLTSDTPSISLIFVWQCSSTRFTGLVSIRVDTKDGIFLIPMTEPMVSSLSNRSIVVTPLIFRNAPFAIPPSLISLRYSSLQNIFTMIVSVKSVIENIKIVFSPRIGRSSIDRICPRITTSPISPIICSMRIVSSSKSRPNITSGLSERLKEPRSRKSRLPPKFFRKPPCSSCFADFFPADTASFLAAGASVFFAGAAFFAGFAAVSPVSHGTSDAPASSLSRYSPSE